MKVYAIDPGPDFSALVVFDGRQVHRHERLSNDVLLGIVGNEIGNHVLVLEQISAMGMAVGAEVFETCAKAIADVARVIVDSAKVEVQMLEVTGAQSATGFIPEEQSRLDQAKAVRRELSAINGRPV